MIVYRAKIGFALILITLLISCGSDSNHAPEIISINVSPVKLAMGKRADLTAVAIDADGDPLIYYWTPSSGEVNKTQSSSASYTAPMESGSHTVKLVVSDGKATDEDQVTIIVIVCDPNTDSECGPTPTPTSIPCGTPGCDTTPSPIPPTLQPTYTSSPPTPTATITPSKIVYASDQDGDWDIYTVLATGGSPINLTQNEKGKDRAPAWSPDGTKIAFASNRTGNWDIFVMNADGSDQRQLTTDIATDYAPAWSFDGTKIVFESLQTGISQIWAVDALNGGFPYAVTRNTYQNYSPTWSPDGNEVAYYSPREGAFSDAIFVTNITTGAERKLKGIDFYNRHPDWGIDGRILFVANNNLAVMNGDGTNAELIWDNYGVEMNPAWGPDQQSLVFEADYGSTNGQIYNVFTMNMNGSNLRQITSHSSINQEEKTTENEGNQPDWGN